ncbi:MerR family transcriptional regulator [Nocardia jiangxiensis]|uniref:MerR family transcriptional regulator n=1 Tax=Nocardia jiangxiensis TaxID=282685 RepID=A0ABW6S4Q2_9NOCA|nr:MerR family transcriptional regulator [Nocardia jiangxiensis]
MRIGELARRASTTPRALRYYESRGLLTTRRDASGYRSYDEADLTILRQIRTLQDCGFELEDIRPFVDCLRAGHPTGDACPSSAEVYRRKLSELDELIGQLHGVRGWIAAQLAGVESAAPELPRCEFGPPLSASDCDRQPSNTPIPGEDDDEH